MAVSPCVCVQVTNSLPCFLRAALHVFSKMSSEMLAFVFEQNSFSSYRTLASIFGFQFRLSLVVIVFCFFFVDDFVLYKNSNKIIMALESFFFY